MSGRLQQFVKRTKSKKEEAIAREKEVRDRALEMVPRCELNEDLGDDASPLELWEGIHANFKWRFGPNEGKSLAATKKQFLKWAVRKLKDPVRTICLVELMLREKTEIDLSPAEESQSENDTALADDASPPTSESTTEMESAKKEPPAKDAPPTDSDAS